MMSSTLDVPRVGTIAPDFVLPTIDRGVIQLADFPRPFVLVFLRHLD
jgi:peroxiredoxin